MLNIILLNSLLTNLICGFQFVVILNFFSTKQSMNDILASSALALLFNRLGRSIAIIGSLTNSDSFKKNDHIIFSFVLFISFICQIIYNDLSIYLSAFFLGVGMSGVTISQRWRITDFDMPYVNLHYSIYSIVGWGIGVILPSILIYFKILQLGFYLEFLILIIPLVLSFVIRNYSSEKLKFKPLPKDLMSPIIIDMRPDTVKYFYIFFSAFIVASSATIFNGILIGLLKNKHQLNDLQVSLGFLFNLLGSVLLLVYPNIVKKRNVPTRLLFSNLCVLLLTFFLFVDMNVVALFLILLFAGTVNTMISTFQLDIISLVNPNKMPLRRIHVFTEFFAVLGGTLVFCLSKYNLDIKIQIILLSVPIVLALAFNLIKEKKITKDIYKIRLARGSDLNFLVDLYIECENASIGQGRFPEHRKKYFKNNENVLIPLEPPLDGFTQFVYYILEDANGNNIGCVTNLRNEAGHEELGMLLTTSVRGKGLGTKALLLVVDLRKQIANKITGLIAETNIPCIRASVNAGAKVLDQSKYLNYSENFINVEFFNRGQS
ncbi:MAG: hypothetical protein ACOYOK_02615 [Pseudobdellovibrionaceae bacterium]